MPADESAWRFYCGVCTKALTDDNALFTSCGHFFCADSFSCTRLKPGAAAGRCEQCSNRCDAGLLDNKGARYDDRVRSFVFKDLQHGLKTMAEIIDFRDKHLSILGENAASQASRIRNLKAEYAAQTQELALLRSENEKVCAENNALRAQFARRATQAVPAHMPRVPSVEIVDASATNIDPLRGRSYPRETVRGTQSQAEDTRVQNANTDFRRYRHPRIDPSRGQDRNSLGCNQLHPEANTTRQISERHWEPRAQATGSSVDPTGTRASKRRSDRVFEPSAAALNRSGRIGASQGPAKRFRRIEQSVITASRAQRPVPRFSSSNPARISGLSRYARGTGSNYVSGSAVRGPMAVQAGDWQRKVSSVPRPSATPDRLGRNPRKRSRLGANPLAGW